MVKSFASQLGILYGLQRALEAWPWASTRGDELGARHQGLWVEVFSTPPALIPLRRRETIYEGGL